MGTPPDEHDDADAFEPDSDPDSDLDSDELAGASGAVAGQGPKTLERAVYDELRREARLILSKHQKQSVTPTMLVHDAYLRLAQSGEKHGWESELHFRRAAALAMRHVLVDRARRRQTLKRGDGWARVTLSHGFDNAIDVDILALNDALEELTQIDPEGASIIQMRFFGELDNPSIAQVLGMSLRTVERNLRAARAWLLDRLQRA